MTPILKRIWGSILSYSGSSSNRIPIDYSQDQSLSIGAFNQLPDDVFTLHPVPQVSRPQGHREGHGRVQVLDVPLVRQLSMDLFPLERQGAVGFGRLRRDPLEIRTSFYVKAHPVCSGKGEAKDAIFGLTMGAGSQSSADVFRWFCVEAGSPSNPSVILLHGFPSQAYSFRTVLPVLSEDYHAIAFDWLGFGFSDKPQPKYGFDYTLDEYTSALESLIDKLALEKPSLVVQGYFAPVVVKYASCHQEKLKNIILLNPPLMEKHVKLPSNLSIFSNFLLGEIFSQDPLRASDKALTSCGPYKMKEEDAMVYRRPYLTSGSSGFALNAISRAMKKDLKAYVESMRTMLASESWKIPTTICWGLRDRWLSYDGVEDFCNGLTHKLVELPMAGHHVQEDSGEELGKIIAQIISKRKTIQL